MSEIIDSIEQDNFNLFKELSNVPENLEKKDMDGWNILSLVTQYEMPEFVEVLLEKLSVSQINNQSPKHPLLIALNNNRVDLAKMIIDKLDINECLRNNETLLHYAAYCSSTETIDYLLERGANPYIKNNQGNSLISILIDKGLTDTIIKLTQREDFSANYSDFWLQDSINQDNALLFEKLYAYTDYTVDEAFDRALLHKKLHIISHMLDDGEILTGQEQISKLIELMCVNYTQKEDKDCALNIAQYLFDLDLSFEDFSNAQGKSAWVLAIENNNESIFNKLLYNSDFMDESDNSGKTPLFYAIEQRNPYFVKMLLKKRADYNAQDTTGDTPLIKAVRRRAHDIIDLILMYPVDINNLNMAGDNALSIAIHKKDMKTVSQLLWFGGDLTTNPAKLHNTISTPHFNTLGVYEKGLEKTVVKEINNFKALITLGFNINQVNPDGDTYLLHFIKNNLFSNFKILTQCKINPNLVDSEQNNALMCAMQQKNNDYVNTLFNKFQNLNLEQLNERGENIYDICLKSKDLNKLNNLTDYDKNFSKEKMQTVLNYSSQHGNLKKLFQSCPRVMEQHHEHYEKWIEYYQDDYNNNLLMLSVAGHKLDNFSFLLSLNPHKIDQKNNNGLNIYDLIEVLPEKIKPLFEKELNQYILSQKKTPH